VRARARARARYSTTNYKKWDTNIKMKKSRFKHIYKNLKVIIGQEYDAILVACLKDPFNMS